MTNKDMLENILDNKKELIGNSPFSVWHYKTKFQMLREIFERYLYKKCKFIDIACGDGDALLLAKSMYPDSNLWGTDIDMNSVSIARSRIPGKTNLFIADIFNLTFLPQEYFDVVHEYGATCLFGDWQHILDQYLRIVKKGGIILWELPEKWSMAHLTYMFYIDRKRSENDTKIKRLMRAFSTSNYTCLSPSDVENHLQSTGYKYEILDQIPLWYFYCERSLLKLVDILYPLFGDSMFDKLDYLNKLIWPRRSGYYLVIQKK